MRFDAAQSLLGVLISDDDEGTAVLVECYAPHCGRHVLLLFVLFVDLVKSGLVCVLLASKYI